MSLSSCGHVSSCGWFHPRVDEWFTLTDFRFPTHARQCRARQASPDTAHREDKEPLTLSQDLSDRGGAEMAKSGINQDTPFTL